MKNGNLIRGLAGLAFIMMMQSVHAVTVGIVDSGTDYKHSAFKSKVWTNTYEADNGVDDDRNGYIDDIYGWNFTDNNNQVVDFKYLDYFGEDIYRFFDIQGKMLSGGATDEDITWLKTKYTNVKFKRDVSMFGNFVHGTHVAGIALKDSSVSKLLSIKIIPTEVGEPGEEDDGGNGNGGGNGEEEESELTRQLREMGRNRTDSERTQIFASLSDQISEGQMQMLKKVSSYLQQSKVDIANGSFGTGFDQISVLVRMLFKPLFDREPTTEEAHKLTVQLMTKILNHGKEALSKSPKTFFVFAAGNDNSNNDVYPVSPANIRAPNTISVAATQGLTSIARFSNYGVKLVDVAAPGVGIYSAIPGNRYLVLSGTSQAAPFVANVAAEIKRVNPYLAPSDIRTILMNTVDAKAYLKNLVASGGIVNKDRAIRAAYLAQTYTIEAAIKLAKKEVNEMPPTWFDEKSMGIYSPISLNLVKPLPSYIDVKNPPINLKKLKAQLNN